MTLAQNPVWVHEGLRGILNRLVQYLWQIAIISLVFSVDTLSGQTVGSMSELVENVRSNELLYDNLEVRLRSTYRLGKPDFPRPEYAVSGESSARFVYQEGMLYLRIDYETKDQEGVAQRSDVLQGFDGKTTRLLEQSVLANIREGKVVQTRLFRPHCLILERAGVSFPLSTYLRGGKDLRALSPYKNATTLIRLEGVEVIDGLRCSKVRIGYHLDSWKPGEEDVRYLWLAQERNYLPVRTEFFQHPHREGVRPGEVGTSTDFREISPGVWFPFRSSLIIYTGLSIAAGQPLVMFNATEFTIDEAKLDPSYDVSLFQDIPFPDGVTVNVIKDDKIVQKYIQGGMRLSAAKVAERKSSNLAAIIAVAVGVAIVAGLAAYAMTRRRKARARLVST